MLNILNAYLFIELLEAYINLVIDLLIRKLNILLYYAIIIMQCLDFILYLCCMFSCLFGVRGAPPLSA